MKTENIKSVTTFKEVIANVMNDLGLAQDMGNYARFLQFTIRIYKNYLRMHHLKTIETIRLRMTEINTIDLPDDYMGFVALGFAENGRMYRMTKDATIVIPTSEDCSVETLDATEDYEENIQQETDADAVGYGVPGGINQYYYKLDLENNRIIIYGPNRTWVTLSYISTGIKLNGETMIPGIAEEAMIAGVHWLAQERDRNIPMNIKQDNQRLFEEAIEMMRMAQAPTLDEIFDAVYETYYQSVKR